MCRVSTLVKRIDMLGTVWAERCQGKYNIVRWWNRKFWTMQFCEDPMRQLEHPFTLCDKDHFIPLHYQNTLHEGREFEPWVRDRFLCLHWQCQTCQTPLLGLLKEKCETDRRERERGGGREGERGKEGERGGVRGLSWRCESVVLSVLDGRFRSGGGGWGGTKRRKGWKKGWQEGKTRGRDQGRSDWTKIGMLIECVKFKPKNKWEREWKIVNKMAQRGKNRGNAFPSVRNAVQNLTLVTMMETSFCSGTYAYPLCRNTDLEEIRVSACWNGTLK